MSTPDQGSNRENDPDGERADFDRRFGEIVAGFGPHGDDDQQPPPAPGSPPASDPPQVVGPQPPPGDIEASTWRESSATGEEDHFVPAATDPLPAGDLHFWGIVAGLTIGPLLILLSALFSAIDTIPWGALGMIGTIAGFVLLVLRSPKHRSGDDGSGARV